MNNGVGGSGRRGKGLADGKVCGEGVEGLGAVGEVGFEGVDGGVGGEGRGVDV